MATAKKTLAKVAPKQVKPVIYALRHPVTGEVRYIGKANNPKARLSGHITNARTGSLPVNRWIRRLVADGLKPAMTIEAEVVFGNWQQVEVDLIAQHREDGARLLNLTSGGDGADGISFENTPDSYVLKVLISRMSLALRRHNKSGESKKARLIADAIHAWREFAAFKPDQAFEFAMNDERIRTYCGASAYDN